MWGGGIKGSLGGAQREGDQRMEVGTQRDTGDMGGYWGGEVKKGSLGGAQRDLGGSSGEGE